MPSYIVKATPTEDFYVMWSTVVDAPTGWGDRAFIESHYPGEQSTPDRFARADANGTSANWPDWPADDQPYSWTDSDGFGLGEVGPYREDGHYSLPRANLRAFCDRLESDPRGEETADLLVFESFQDDPA